MRFVSEFNIIPAMLKNTMRIEILGPDNLDAQLSLQERVEASLENDWFLVHRDAGDWRRILASPDYAVYGIFDGARLVASGTAHFPNGSDPRDIPEFQPVPDRELAIFQAAMVDADYRGMDLMKLLQEMRQGAAAKRKRGKIICKISAGNVRSWKVTINNGFHCVRVAPDHTGHDKMYFIKKLSLVQGFFTK